MKKRLSAAIIAVSAMFLLFPARAEAQVLDIIEEVDSATAEAERNIYARLPEGIRSALEETGYVYYSDVITQSGHAGTTYILPDRAIGEGKASTDVKYDGDVMIHEIGHYIDVCYQGYSGGSDECCYTASDAAEWQKLYAKYKDTIAGFGGLSKYEVYNANEAFAEAYSHVIRNRKMVERKAPEIVDYVDRVNADVIARYAKETINISAEYNTEEFDAAAYYSRYPDLRLAFGQNAKALYDHWITYGKAEGRKAR